MKPEMISQNLAVPKRALSISAHPDDSEFGCGGTLAKWSSQGCEVSLMVCTDGSKGTWDIDKKPEDLISTRKMEQAKAASELGLTGDIIFLDIEDGALTYNPLTRDRIAKEIRRLKPNIILSHDPWKPYRLHPDHRHCGQLVCDAVVVARDPHYLKDSSEQFHRPQWLLLFEAGNPNHLEDISAFQSHKLKALWSHESQWESTMGVSDSIDSPKGRKAVQDFEDTIIQELKDFGKLAKHRFKFGSSYAEAFRKIPV